MAGDTEQLNDGEPTTFWRLDGDSESIQRLFPELPDGYIEKNNIQLDSRKPKKPSILPYVSIDVRPGKRDDNGDSKKNEIAVEIGVKMEF